MLRVLWRLTRGYRLRPWRSPYLLWRIETYWGWPAGRITFTRFWSFVWHQRAAWMRYLRWAAREDSRQKRRQKRNRAGLTFTVTTPPLS